MSSQRRIDASRANGAKSRGPVTPEGRARSNMAAVTHGLRSRTVLLKNESEEDFNALHDLLVDHFQPANPYETDLVERLVAARWRLDRVSSMETALLEVEVARREPEIEKEFKSCCPEVRNALAFRALFDESRVLAGLSRYESRFRRTCEKLTKELNSLRALRKLNEGPNPKNDQPPAAPQPPEPQHLATQDVAQAPKPAASALEPTPCRPPAASPSLPRAAHQSPCVSTGHRPQATTPNPPFLPDAQC